MSEFSWFILLCALEITSLKVGIPPPKGGEERREEREERRERREMKRGEERRDEGSELCFWLKLRARDTRYEIRDTRYERS